MVTYKIKPKTFTTFLQMFYFTRNYGLKLSPFGTRDIIGHVTIGLVKCVFLLVVNLNQLSISDGFWDIEPQKILGSCPWPFWVTWHHRSCYHSTSHTWFPIGGPLQSSLYLAWRVKPSIVPLKMHLSHLYFFYVRLLQKVKITTQNFEDTYLDNYARQTVGSKWLGPT